MIRRTLCTAAALASLAATSPASAQTMPPEEYMELSREIFSELIEINTTNTERGNNTLAAQALARHLLEAGFPECNSRVCRVSADFRIANYLYAAGTIDC